jgi:hypothetical protein
MSGLPIGHALGVGARARYYVRTLRTARPPTPWTWAICEEGRPEPVRCSTQHYRSAEDAWAVGSAVLDRLPKATLAAASSPGGADADHSPARLSDR